MSKILISFTDPQLDWLRAEAKRLGITITELTRRIVDDYRGANPVKNTAYLLTPITAEELTATDLRAEVNADDAPFACYRLTSPRYGEVGNLIYAEGRAGLAWGADAQWTDCESAEDAVERFLGVGGKEMVN